jgi:Ca2+-dependent lipid-binding protein
VALSGCKSGKIRISVEWKPLSMAGSFHDVEQYVPPIGEGRGCQVCLANCLRPNLGIDNEVLLIIRNVEATLGGKAGDKPFSHLPSGAHLISLQNDPYMRVQIGDVTLGRTEVIKNSTTLSASYSLFCL